MPVLGMRGTGEFSSDDRPKNYRQTILLLFPNASAPLTAILSKLKDEETDDPEFKIFQKTLPSQRAIVSGSQTSGDTVIELQTSADNKKFKPGHAVLNERTLEVVWVTASGTAGQITVIRGQGVSAASMNDGDGLLIVGSHYMEGADFPTAVSYDPTVVSNYTQIFRSSLDITNTAKQTNVRWADGQAIKELKREALELHSIEMERAFMFGAKKEDTTGSKPERTTQGLLNYITTNVKDFAGAVSIDAWENFMEDCFESGSSEKLALVGNRALNVLNKLARAHHTITATPPSSTYGVQMTTWLTPYGTLQLKQHPLLSENATFNSWGFIVDPARVVYRYLRGRDTQYLENRQSPGADASKNEFLTECGLELQFETAHGVFKNASAFSA